MSEQPKPEPVASPQAVEPPAPAEGDLASKDLDRVVGGIAVAFTPVQGGGSFSGSSDSQS